MASERVLTAMYDSRGAAETARDSLVELGISQSAVMIHGTDAAGAATTTEPRGFWASLADMFMPDDERETYAEGVRRGGYVLSVHVPQGLEEQAERALELSEPIDLDERSESWRQGGWAGARQTASDTSALGSDASGFGSDASALGARETMTPRPSATALAGDRGTEDTIPVVEEQLRVGKREVGRGNVRVRSYVVERPVEEQVSLRNETVDVERKPVDRPVAAGDRVFQDKQIEAVERREEPVVSKEARVIEEVGLRKNVDTRTETVRDTVRKQEVEVEGDRGRLDKVGVAGTSDRRP